MVNTLSAAAAMTTVAAPDAEKLLKVVAAANSDRYNAELQMLKRPTKRPYSRPRIDFGGDSENDRRELPEPRADSNTDPERATNLDTRDLRE